MWKHCFTGILLSYLLAACSHYQQKGPPPVLLPSIKITKTRNLAPFSQLDAQGRINLSLHTGYGRPKVILSGDSRDVAAVKTVVSGTTLYLSLGKGYPRYGAVDAEIYTSRLNRLTYNGEGLIRGPHLQTRYMELYLNNQGTTQLGGAMGLQILEVSGSGLTQISGITSHDLRIRLRGNPKVQLIGSASLSKIDVDGGGWISLYWIKSYHLLVRASRTARIQLAGIVNRLDVELWDKARFKGRYLRAQRSFVKTHDHSIAEISSVHHQSSLASDASDIYYYNIPTFRTDFMAFNGSVLNMREWNLFDKQDYNRYNKQFP